MSTPDFTLEQRLPFITKPMPLFYLHIGAGKTGTSFLQAQLAIQHELLFNSNIYYPTSKRILRRIKNGQVTSGNIEELMPWILPKHPSVIRQDRVGDTWLGQSIQWLETTINTARGRNILLSGEALQHAESDRISCLVDKIKDLGYETRILFYVRHALDHALSDYREHVQRGFRDGYDRHDLRSVEGWLTNHRVPYFRTLKAYSSVLPDSKMIVRSYDASKHELWNSFLGLMSLPPLPTAKNETNGFINRSLTILETQFLESAASRLSQSEMFHIGMKLISKPPFKVIGVEPKSFMISDAVLDAFQNSHNAMIEDINERWLNALSTPIYAIPPDFKAGECKARPHQLLDLAYRLLSDQA